MEETKIVGMAGNELDEYVYWIYQKIKKGIKKQNQLRITGLYTLRRLTAARVPFG